MKRALLLMTLILPVIVFAQSGQKVVATVNDDIQVTLDELQGEIRMLPRENQSLATTKEGVEQILDAIIQQKLLADRAETLKMDTVAVVREAIKRSTESILADYLMISIRSTVEPPTAEEAQQFYTANESLFYTAPTVELKQIIMTSEDDAKKVEKALKGGKDFDKLMEQYPGIPGGAQSGELGIIALNQLTPTVVQAIEGVDAGNWAGPIEVNGAYFFLYIVSRKEPTKLEFEDVSENLIEQLTSIRAQNAVNGYIQSLVDNAKVTVDNAVLKEAILTPAPPVPSGN